MRFGSLSELSNVYGLCSVFYVCMLAGGLVLNPGCSIIFIYSGGCLFLRFLML